MLKYRTTNQLYTIYEISKKGTETHHRVGTEAEITAYLKSLNEMNGYVPGLGGDRSYSAWAVLEVNTSAYFNA